MHRRMPEESYQEMGVSLSQVERELKAISRNPRKNPENFPVDSGFDLTVIS
jgi:hypothetical protein